MSEPTRQIIEPDNALESLGGLVGLTITGVATEEVNGAVYARILLSDGTLLEFSPYGSYESWAALYPTPA